MVKLLLKHFVRKITPKATCPQSILNIRNIGVGTVVASVLLGGSIAPSLASPQITAGLFGLPIPDIPIPGGSLGNVLQGAIVEQLLQALGGTLSTEAPITSSANAIFPTLDTLPGSAFQPQAAPPTLIEQIRTSNDGSVTLLPGDYTIPIDVFCMKVSAHSPDGHRYVLAPLAGKWADIITALNARSAGTSIPHSQLQVLSWNLQAGMKYEELTPELQAIVDQLLPDYKSRLSQSWYEAIEAKWSELASTIPGLPSMDASLERLGDVGHAIVTLRETRETLMRYGNDYEALSDRLVLTGNRASSESTALPGGESTPWSQVSPRVYARLVTEGNYATPAELQVRVLDDAQVSQSSNWIATTDLTRSLALASTPAEVPLAGLVGDPQDSSVQPLSMSPRPGNPNNPNNPNNPDDEESGSGSLHIQEKGFTGPQPDPLNQV